MQKKKYTTLVTMQQLLPIYNLWRKNAFKVSSQIVKPNACICRARIFEVIQKNSHIFDIARKNLHQKAPANLLQFGRFLLKNHQFDYLWCAIW